MSFLTLKISDARMTLSRQLVVMVKEPRAGRVKSRLARIAGPGVATMFYRHQTAAVLSRVHREREWLTLLAVAPDVSVRSPAWPKALDRRGQGGGSLGARMQRLFDRLPPGPVTIIGSDIPGITAPLIRQAFRALGDADAVVGPASDGGYWLIGLKRRFRVPKIFARVRWSTEHALADTLAHLDGRKVAILPTLDDVDNAADLVRLGRARGRRVPPAPTRHL